MYKKTNTPAEFEIWYEAQHKEECNANYEGSFGGMEVQGIIEMFKNSVNLQNAKYSHYIGDGDSKTFTNLSAAQPYGENFVITTLQCVLHVCKRMFRHLKDLKKTLTEKKKPEKAAEKKNEEKEARKNGATTSQPKKKPPPKKKHPNEPKTTGLTGKVMKKLSIYCALAIQRNINLVADTTKVIWAAYYHSISTDGSMTSALYLGVII